MPMKAVESLSSEAAAYSHISRTEELRIFHDVAKALTSSLNLDQVLQTILEKMATLFRPETWSLLIVDEQKNDLYFAIAIGDSAGKLKAGRQQMGEGVAGWVAQHGEPLIVSDQQANPRFPLAGGAGSISAPESGSGTKTRSIICLPLKSKDKVLGVIQLINCRVEEFSDRELFLLHALCDYAAIAIDNARSVERIQELTITDEVTGLFNARHLYKVLESEVYRSQRFGYQFSVIFIDLDRFKRVNDSHGHQVGSRLLAEIGFRIKEQLRLIDYAFRYGGDEFVVLLPQTDKSAALVVAKRLKETLRTERFLATEGYDLAVECSIGIASFPEDARTANDIILRADEQMYLVKNTSRNAIAMAQFGIVG
ncbi:MAG: sensor domain-containing diguanylate cyclase [Acidobacteriaceae bacterium]